MKKKGLFLALSALVPATFITLHSTPKNSIRTHLLKTGNFNSVLNTDIIRNDKYTKLNNQENEEIYTLSEPATENGTIHFNYKVKKKWFLYFANKFLS